MELESVQLRYIELLKSCVTYWNWLTDEEKAKRRNGRDWPREKQGETMIGLERLDNIYACLKAVVEDGIEGDLIEAGVWRGGAVIFMKGILEAFGVEDKKIWVADSFHGVPRPNTDLYPADKGDELYKCAELRVSKQEVIENFKKYGLLDEKIVFLEGLFKDTLYDCEIEKLALLRIDGDLYESTFQALDALYPKLTEGGFCIIDDFGTFEYCAKAVFDYRNRHKIRDEIRNIDDWGIYWRKGGAAPS